MRLALPGWMAYLKKLRQQVNNSVEFYGFNTTDNYFKHEPKEVAAMLKANNIVSPSGHYQLNLFDENGQQVIYAAKEIGHKYIVIPWLPQEERSTLDQYKGIAEKLTKAGELCKKNNIKFAYHNHDFEFKKFENDACGYDVLIKDVDKSLMDFELDLFWVVSAGLDPVDLFKKHPGRFKMWHVKDMDKTDGKKQTEVGSGSINFKRIFSKAKLAGVEYFYVEQENLPVPGDANIKKSIQYVKRNLLPLVK